MNLGNFSSAFQHITQGDEKILLYQQENNLKSTEKNKSDSDHSTKQGELTAIEAKKGPMQRASMSDSEP